MNLKSTWMRTLPALLLVFGFVMSNQSSLALAAVNDNFELDGNIAQAGALPDWENFFNADTTSKALPSGFIASAFSRDFTLSKTNDSSTFTTGSKDTLSINPGWQCAASNNVGDKVDLLHTYAAAYRDSSNSDLYAYVGAERASTSGDADLGIWLLQDRNVSCSTLHGTATFSGTHTDGDLLMTTGFSSGGSIPTVEIFRWNGGANGSLSANPIATSGAAGSNADCTVIPSTAVGCGIVNSANLTPPWATQPKGCTPTLNTDGTPKTNCALPANQFFEGGFNITQALSGLGLSVPCFANVLIDTRSSTSPTATIFDYTLHSFPTCGSLVIDKTVNGTASIPAGVTFNFTVNRCGANSSVGSPGTCTSPTPVATPTIVGPSTSSDVVGNLPSGLYQVHEEAPPPGYQVDLSTQNQVVLITPSPTAVHVLINNKLLYKVIVLVCDTQNNLHPSQVGLNDSRSTTSQANQTTMSAADASASGLTQAQLCNLGPASYTDLTPGGASYAPQVNIP